MAGRRRRIPQDLGSELRAHRRNLGMTQQDVANEIGLSQQRYANWENGMLPRPGRDEFPEVIRTLARFLDVPATEVLRLAFIPDEPPGAAEAAYQRRIDELHDELAAAKKKAAKAG